MKRQDIITLAFTFFVGICFGIYLYFMGFSGLFTSSTVPSADDSVTLNIIGEAYGGCRSDCPSFLVQADGSYRYLYTPAAGEQQIIRTGTLPFSLTMELSRMLTPAALMAQSEPREPAFCNSYTDGVDVRYRVTRDNVTYELDTCGTAVVTESTSWQALVKIWNYFETIGG